MSCFPALRRRLSWIGAAVSLAVLLAVCGCAADISVREASARERLEYSAMAITGAGDVTPCTRNVLANFLLLDLLYSKPEKLIDALQKLYGVEPRPEYLIALSEVSLRTGVMKARDPDRAVSWYLGALIYSHKYLAGGNSSETEAYRPERYSMTRIYDVAATELFAYLSSRRLERDHGFELIASGGQRVEFAAPVYKLAVAPEAVEKFVLCADYVTENLTHDSRDFGIGVSLIAALRRDSIASGLRFAENQMIPATAVIKFKPKTGSGADYTARIEFLNSRDLETAELGGHPIPLERDLSTPLAYMSRDPLPFNFLEYTLLPEKTGEMQGLYRFEPCSDQRIPVVLVHGLMSDTRTWVQLINTLQSDPVLRKNYQFMGFSYSSGNPVSYSALLFRQALENERANLIKSGKSVAAFDRMVVVGHSMGGLVARLAISDSGDIAVRYLAGNQTPDEYFAALPDDLRKTASEMLFFKALPFVKRVIFVAVPHRGSVLATRWYGRLGSKLVTLPKNVIRRQDELIRGLIADGRVKSDDLHSTGIDNLAPDAAILKILAELPISPSVPYHSIIGNWKAGDIPGGSDGVVDYSSSHLEGAVDELVVKSGHSAQKNPLAIQAIRRILLEHLKQYPEPGKAAKGRISGGAK